MRLMNLPDEPVDELMIWIVYLIVENIKSDIVKKIRL